MSDLAATHVLKLSSCMFVCCDWKHVIWMSSLLHPWCVQVVVAEAEKQLHLVQQDVSRIKRSQQQQKHRYVCPSSVCGLGVVLCPKIWSCYCGFEGF